MKHKGFKNWIEIFKGGRQTDSRGNEHDGDKIIETAVKTFDPSYHEPPLVVGHPKDNDPAFGWVESLKTVDDNGTKVLMAKLKDVAPAFEETSRSGLYKKRSASFYADGRLRHVGVLGAMPPAVKGLADLRFNAGDQDYISFDFYQPNDKKEEDAMKFSDFAEMFKFWKQVQKNPDAAIPDFSEGAKGLTQADVEAARKKAEEDTRKQVETEFAEKENQGRKKAEKKEISDWCEAMASKGKIPPSWVKGGLVEFMQGLDSDSEISFAEDGDKKTALDYFKSILEGFEKSTIFQEMATKERAADGSDFAEEDMAGLTMQV